MAEDNAVGTPNVEVVALLAACSVNFKSSFFSLKYYCIIFYLYFDTIKILSNFFFALLS